MTDPFGDEENNNVADTSVSLTFKGDGNYYSPWIVLHGPDVATITEMVDEKLQELMKLSTKYGKAYYELAETIKGERTGGGSGGGGGNRGGGGRQAAGPKDHPEGKKEFCEHGEMVFKSGAYKKTTQYNKAGDIWKAFDCASDVCDRRWDNGK